MEGTDNPFPQFPGEFSHRLAFPNFYKSVLNALEHMGSRDYGLLGYVLPVEEWLQLPHNTEAFTPAQPPGNAPPPTPAAPWQEWQYKKQCYDAEKKLLNTATAHFVKVLDEHAMSVVEGEENTIRGKSLAQLLNALKNEYGTITKNDLLIQLNTLQIPYERGGDILQYLLQHSKVHRVAAENGQPWPEMTKIGTLIAGLTPCGLFDACINAFHTAYPALQHQRYHNLERSVRAYAQNQIFLQTTGSEGYAAAAQQAPRTPPVDHSHVEEVVTKILTKLLPAMNLTKYPREKKYCWTHGVQYTHSSAECKHPHHDHDNSATLQDRKGGRNNWKDRKKT